MDVRSSVRKNQRRRYCGQILRNIRLIKKWTAQREDVDIVMGIAEAIILSASNNRTLDRVLAINE